MHARKSRTKSSLLEACRICILYSSIILSWTNSSLCLSIHRIPSRRQHTSYLYQHSSDFDAIDGRDNDETAPELRSDSRRSFVRSAFITASAIISSGESSAGARGLVRFPCNDQPLLNTYHFMRAGSSLLEIDDVWSTNPLFLTNREAALSEQGEEEVRRACNMLNSMGLAPTIVRYSLAASSIDTANIVGAEFNIGRDRLVPEFNYMDPRAVGAWDFSSKNVTEEAVWAMDADEGGVSGRGGRPPPNEDGTPAETLSDQVVRLTNLMSVLETLYSGDEILLVFPDGTGPALLSCLIGGIPLNRVHEFNFLSGEIRPNVDFNSVNAIAAELPSPYYTEILQRGRQELIQLRENPDKERNIKDLKFEEERLAADAQQKEKQELGERKARQIELEKRQRLEEERRIKEEQRKERQAQAKQKEVERRKMKEAREVEENSTSSTGAIGGVLAGVALLAASSIISSSTESEINDAVNVTSTLANSTILETEKVDVVVHELETTVSSSSDNGITEPNESIDTSSNILGSVPDSSRNDETIGSEDDNSNVQHDENSSDLTNGEDSFDADYDDWGDAWLGTIREIMDDEPEEVLSSDKS